jgi:hypothetical protein
MKNILKMMYEMSFWWRAEKREQKEFVLILLHFSAIPTSALINSMLS